MGFTFKVETRKLPALIKRLDKLDGMVVDVGFFEEDRYGPENNNLPVATVAYYNEYGTRYNPTRPFMEETFTSSIGRRYIQAMYKKIFEDAIMNGRSITRLMRELGEDVAGLMQTTILNYPGSNSPATVAAKGKNTPLRDTEFMMKSVKFQITRRR